MTVAPYSYILVGQERCVTVSGSMIYAFNSTTGEILSSTSNTTEGQAKGTNAATGLVVAAAVNESFTHFLSVGENKIMKLWELPELKLINERELPKRPTCLAFTKNSQTILVSDKFGDVFSYPFDYTSPDPKPTRDELSSHENPSDGHLVLGHASPLNAFLFSYDEKYIITADRDEHIRVSWYPQGYNIETYCLGHRRYVSAIHIPPFSPETLISGGGDPSLKLWNWLSGRCIGEVQIWESVEPFIVVKSKKHKHTEEDQDDSGVQKRKGKGKKAKRRARKDARAKVDEKNDNEIIDESKGEGETEGKEDEQGPNDSLESAEEAVLVVNKIGSIRREDSNFVVFSAVGASALFGFQYPAGVIEHIDFKHPIIDMTTDGVENIWVSLDLNRSAPDSVPSEDTRSVRVVQVSGSGKFMETPPNAKFSLLNRLNEARATTGPSDKCLDFYADLKGMPKWSEPSVRTTAGDSVKDVDESVSSNTALKPLTRREEARMKNKKNVLARMQDMEGGSFAPPNPLDDENEKTGKVRAHEEIEEDAVEGREAKRAKSVMDSGDGDVEMRS